MTYEIVKASTIQELVEKVNDRIKNDGCVPIGGIAIEYEEKYYAIEMKLLKSTFIRALIKQ